ncbi:non-specific lipid transfer protein GPI-anchored 31-like [Andrographis paniculata]|uniref:non-specific lipid transfer protein GPI-anchored 31-like n=1 Tax=Andrographis paniculata TaxID=175694 RepID=UPI0021E99396|nr:non-specific lipid transfer protein GPI-anchored 31-like [Andrographis paniculata]
MGFRFSLLCVLFALSAAAVSAAHSAPAPAVDCTTLVMNMADCLSYVTVGGNAKEPGRDCCNGLESVLKTNAECLCEVFKNSAQLGITLNVSKAMNLPVACHKSAPSSLRNCAVSVAPGAAPALSPVPLSPSPSSIAEAPASGSGDTEVPPVPAPSPGSSASSALTITYINFLVSTIVAAASFALF